jgi:hypothetical protein
MRVLLRLVRRVAAMIPANVGDHSRSVLAVRGVRKIRSRPECCLVGLFAL